MVSEDRCNTFDESEMSRCGGVRRLSEYERVELWDRFEAGESLPPLGSPTVVDPDQLQIRQRPSDSRWARCRQIGGVTGLSFTNLSPSVRSRVDPAVVLYG